ncbi:MAG: hypothetical protein ACREJ3_08890, partial [Polyangiaceae bacterium]
DVPLYRTFVTDEKDRPKIGVGNFMLGARVPIDIKPDRDGMVGPGRGGMYVTPNDPSGLPPHLRPTSLVGGQSTLPVFVIAASDLGPSLRFQPAKRHPERHGYVEPAMAMKLEAYQNALGSTVSEWVPWKAAA